MFVSDPFSDPIPLKPEGKPSVKANRNCNGFAILPTTCQHIDTNGKQPPLPQVDRWKELLLHLHLERHMWDLHLQAGLCKDEG